ncbi:hypothetical protein EC988_002648 [Linderina pennispora]|nr:hypothetical protein EC988_002648 [Linderina pennispora]
MLSITRLVALTLAAVACSLVRAAPISQPAYSTLPMRSFEPVTTTYHSDWIYDSTTPVPSDTTNYDTVSIPLSNFETPPAGYTTYPVSSATPTASSSVVPSDTTNYDTVSIPLSNFETPPAGYTTYPVSSSAVASEVTTNYGTAAPTATSAPVDRCPAN